MAFIDNVLKVFNNNIRTVHYRTLAHNDAQEIFNQHPYQKFLTIPIDNSEQDIEIPVFVYNEHRDLIEQRTGKKNIVVPLYHNNTTLNFKTTVSLLKNTFTENLYQGGLTKLYINNKDTGHYGTIGSIFNSKFEPVFLCVWKITRDDQYIPIIKYSPSLFQKKNDPIATTLTGKLFRDLIVSSAYSRNERFTYTNIRAFISPTFEPLKFSKVIPPTVETTKEQLLETVLSNVDNFFEP